MAAFCGRTERNHEDGSFSNFSVPATIRTENFTDVRHLLNPENILDVTHCHLS